MYSLVITLMNQSNSNNNVDGHWQTRGEGVPFCTLGEQLVNSDKGMSIPLEELMTTCYWPDQVQSTNQSEGGGSADAI